ncbi:flagellar protein FliT [Thiorhodococcus minor]|uniref:Flagellar protein FliT n=1 Tax=Thiorhodococcus minor TaxID=57489 RepID=A0A6M0JW33_9GAMM|nr:flagellar protein FliT [Thiorhodococcus minor]NEV60537.1 flagellar protein FliT [Thiorhodococcus minor]
MSDQVNPSVDRLIGSLHKATVQMRQASIGDDWQLAARLQKRRALLVEQIRERLGGCALTAKESLALRTIRRLEAEITSRAMARRQKIARLLEQGTSNPSKERRRRIRQAYDIPETRT